MTLLDDTNQSTVHSTLLSVLAHTGMLPELMWMNFISGLCLSGFMSFVVSDMIYLPIVAVYRSPDNYLLKLCILFTREAHSKYEI